MGRALTRYERLHGHARAVYTWTVRLRVLRLAARAVRQERGVVAIRRSQHFLTPSHSGQEPIHADRRVVAAEITPPRQSTKDLTRAQHVRRRERVIRREQLSREQVARARGRQWREDDGGELGQTVAAWIARVECRGELGNDDDED